MFQTKNQSSIIDNALFENIILSKFLNYKLGNINCMNESQ